MHMSHFEGWFWTIVVLLVMAAFPRTVFNWLLMLIAMPFLLLMLVFL